MGKCENCIYYDVCYDRIEFGGTHDFKGENGDCDYYKDKSLFVELPYEVGQVVYVIRSQTSNGKNLYLREERISHYRIFGNDYFMCFESGGLSVPSYKWKDTVFLTEEQAKAKLKEKE